MPTTKDYGTEGAANKAIGGVPTVHYFDFGSKGRGQVLRLMLEVGLQSAACLVCVKRAAFVSIIFMPVQLTFSGHLSYSGSCKSLHLLFQDLCAQTLI